VNPVEFFANRAELPLFELADREASPPAAAGSRLEQFGAGVAVGHALGQQLLELLAEGTEIQAAIVGAAD
jgi:hypothetical protein